MNLNQITKFLGCLKQPFIHQRCVNRNMSRIHPRTIVASFKNQSEYEESLRMKEMKTKQKDSERGRKKKNENKEQSFVDETVEKETVSEDLRKLKVVHPNPAKLGQFSKIMLNLKSKKFRERHHSCLLEGKFLIKDALDAGIFVRTIYFSRLKNLEGLPLEILSKTNLVKVSLTEIKLASEVHHQATGLMAIATKPQEKAIRHMKSMRDINKKNVLPLTLICDGVKDPGNLGTLLRTASSAGCHQVLVTTGSCDVWDPKAIRAGGGAHFKIPIISNLYWDEVEDDLKSLNTTKIIASHHLLNSLNPNELHQSDPVGDLIKDKNEEESNDSDSNELENSIQSEFHCDLSYFDRSGHTVLIVGGEVNGITKEAFFTANKLSKDTNCEVSLAKIPMFDEKDCLNASIAGSVIMFEAKRQYMELMKNQNNT